MLEPGVIRRIRRVAGWVLLAALLFYLFFMTNKRGPLGAVNPFADDPYDAVGSFAFQIALLAGTLSYARALRLWEDPSLAGRARLILRGDLLALFAILATLAADAVAVFQYQAVFGSLLASLWGRVLLGELAGMFLLALACGVALLAVFGPLSLPDPPRALTPADAIDDLWALVRRLVAGISGTVALPAGPGHPHSHIIDFIDGFTSDRFFARLGWVDPRRHPWRFAVAFSLLAGLGLFAAHLREGLPPSLGIGLLLAVVFIGGESLAVLLGYVILGGFLGLRPS
jgi:hypothetical protein